MRNFAFAICLVLLAVALTGLAQQKADESSLFRHASTGMSIALPNFEDDNTAPITILGQFFAPQKQGQIPANMNIQKQTTIKSLDQYKQISEQQFQQFKFEVTERTDRHINGRPAIEYAYGGALQGRNFRFRALAVECDGFILLATCTAPAETFEQYDEKFKASLASLQFSR